MRYSWTARRRRQQSEARRDKTAAAASAPGPDRLPRRQPSLCHAPFREMDPDPPDHRSLGLALSQARDWLRSLQKRHLESLRPAQHSLEEALAAVLQEEERLWARAREERARLQAELTAIQEANGQAVQAGMAKIQALWHQLSSLHVRLLAGPETVSPAELAQEAAVLLSRNTCLALNLTWAHFVPQPGVPTLGELRLEKQALCFLPPKSPARAKAGHQDWVVAQESTARAGGKEAQANAGGACVGYEVGISEPLQEEGPSVEEEAVPVSEGELDEEGGTQRALPARGNISTPSLVGKSPGGCLPQEAVARDPGTVSAPRSAGAQGILPEDSATLFHARPVALQEESSGSSGGKGGDGTRREQVLKGSRVPSARGPLPRWASAESLGRWWGAPHGGGTRLGGSCMELGPQKVEGGSPGQQSAFSSSCFLGGGISLGETAPAPPLTHQRSSLAPRWPTAWHAQALPPTLTAPPPPCNQLVGQWGKQGSRHGQLRLPHGLHATPAGPLYVVDFGNRRLQELGTAWRRLPLRGKAYFDVTVGKSGRLALTNTTWRCVELYSARGVLLHAMSEGFVSPRGLATSPQGEFLVADMRLGALHVLVAGSGQGCRLVRCNTILGFHKPYLVATNSHGEVALSERGLDGGCCVKVLGADWQVLRVLGGRSSPPILTNPWGVSLDESGRVLVADWGRHTHMVFCYPATGGRGWAVVTEGLSSPRGVALLGKRHFVVADSMHHCLKTFRYC